jgi:hypothetical protein
MRSFILNSLITLAAAGSAQPCFSQGTPPAPLYLFTAGNGSITPLQNGQSLEVGQTYDMTAVPDAGFAFSSWQPVQVFVFTQITLDAQGNPNPPITSTVASPVPQYTYDPDLEFTMQPEMSILNNPGVETITEDSGWQANFTPVPEPSTWALLIVGGALLLRRRKVA